MSAGMLEYATYLMIARREKSHYRLIGPAVVNGVMLGEAWPDESTLKEIVVW